jgi:stage V sporulation protein D (sporulation-specific penicillin-binding protein)
MPAEEPQLTLLVMIDEPQKLRWGSQAAAPVFQRVAQQALHYLQIPPRRARALTMGAAARSPLTTFQEEQPFVNTPPSGVVQVSGEPRVQRRE